MAGGSGRPERPESNIHPFDWLSPRYWKMTIDLAELRSLPPDKKLQIINLLWDDLHITGLPQLPQSELDEIDRRYRRMLEHPEQTLTGEQMWARVDELLK
jgi:hypothetical protein